MTSSHNFLSQQTVWDDRAANWDNWGFEEPLSPTSSDLQFQREHITKDGATLVLGATKSLCELALQQSASVTSVDFSPAAIKQFGIDHVNYRCQDWITYLQTNSQQFDTAITDNGLSCVEFPIEWELFRDALHSRLVPDGIFSMRAFVATETPTKDHYENPNLQRIIPAIGRVSIESDWMTVKPADGITNFHPARYTFPSAEAIESLFSERFLLVDKHIPEYEEGEHFVSFAFQRKP